MPTTTSKSTNTRSATKTKTTIRSQQKLPCTIVSPESTPSPSKKHVDFRMKLASQREAFLELKILKAANGGKLKRGEIRKMALKYQKFGYKGVTEDSLHYKFKLMKKGKVDNNIHAVESPSPPPPPLPPPPSQPVAEVDVETPRATSTNEALLNTESQIDEISNEEKGKESVENDSVKKKKRKKAGRKKGSTVAASEECTRLIQDALTKATEQYHVAKILAYSEGTKIPNGTLKNIIAEIEADMKITPGLVRPETIRSRIRINNHTGKSKSRTTPLYEIEAVIVDFCIRLSRMGQGLTREEVIDLADELIRGTIHEERLKEHKLQRKIDDTGLGLGWYRGFLRRHKGKIKTRKSRVQDANRSTWCTYNNFVGMYDEVYDMMVEAGVEIKLDEKVMLDINGKVVYSKDEMYGRPTQFQVTKPEQILFVDETGSNTNQKDDGLEGGQRVVTGANQTEGACIGSTTDIHFTVLCFTAGTGEPVMCGIILKSDKDISEIPLTWSLGVDITKDPLTGKTTSETYELNSEKDGATRGGPVCKFKGQELACFVTTSPKASITSQILADMLHEIDKKNLYDRSEGSVPFLLLDGHHSRCKLPFLEYITDPEHEWMVCVGVPYGTHLWQVADSSELNGCFKMQLTKAKKNYRKFKPIKNKGFETSDVIPLINHAWALSFARTNVAKKAVAARGWGPLNYILLDHPDLIHFEPTASEEAIAISKQGRQTIEINLNDSIAGAHLDAIFEDNKLCASRQKAWEENKLLNEDRATRFQDIKQGLGNLTTGKLVKRGHHCMSRKELRDHVRSHDEKKRKLNEDVAERKATTNMKHKEKVKEANRRFRTKKGMRLNDMKTLLREHHVDGDSPTKTNLPEVTIQWEKRGKRRVQEQLNLLDIIEDEAVVDDNNDYRIDSISENIDRMVSENACVSDLIADGTSNGSSNGSNMSNDIWSANPFDSLVLLSSLATDVSQVEEV